MGLDGSAQVAVRAARKTYMKRGGPDPLRLAVAASGDLIDLCGLVEPYGRRVRQIVVPHRARTWETLAPFVPPRYLKARGKNTLEGQVYAELLSRGFPEPVEVYRVMLDGADAGRHTASVGRIKRLVSWPVRWYFS